VYANHCNTFSADVDALQSGGHSLTWELISGQGTIDSITGFYESGALSIGTHPVTIAVRNDCSPPICDFCQFTIEADTKDYGRAIRGIRTQAESRFGEDRVWGPEGAESIGVAIDLDGPVSILESLGFKPYRSPAGYYRLKISVEDYDVLRNTKGVSRITVESNTFEFNSILSPLLDTSTVYFRAESARDTFQATGSGVIIGVIDKGIDVNHLDFQADDGSTRVLYYWNQKASTGGYPPPPPFQGGRVWTGGSIDSGGYSGSHVDEFHGTYVAGIAAGSGRDSSLSRQFVGFAPDVNLILVDIGPINFNENFIQGADFIRRMADDLDRPCVITASLSMNLDGPRNGTSELERDIQAPVPHSLLWDK
jgi:hypothetical protein